MNEDLLKNEILKTLSFLDPMGLDRLFLDLDSKFVKAYPELTYDDLLKCLNILTKSKKAKLIEVDGHKQWIKVFPKKSLSKRTLNKILSFFFKE